MRSNDDEALVPLNEDEVEFLLREIEGFTAQEIIDILHQIATPPESSEDDDDDDDDDVVMPSPPTFNNMPTPPPPEADEDLPTPPGFYEVPTPPGFYDSSATESDLYDEDDTDGLYPPPIPPLDFDELLVGLSSPSTSISVTSTQSPSLLQTPPPRPTRPLPKDEPTVIDLTVSSPEKSPEVKVLFHWKRRRGDDDDDENNHPQRRRAYSF